MCVKLQKADDLNMENKNKTFSDMSKNLYVLVLNNKVPLLIAYKKYVFSIVKQDTEINSNLK